MLFSSPIFLFFYLPIFLLMYYVLPERWQNTCLFIGSLVFYAWGEGGTVLVLLASISINFGAGKIIERGYRTLGLWLSLVGSLSLLIYYKYINFLVDSIHSVSHWFGLTLVDHIAIEPIILPIGISFYTFQGISYALDVYWGRLRASHDFVNYGAYVAMFPHQIAGPIVRYADIASELAKRTLSIEKFGIGAERFMIGLVKKMLLANTFAEIADTVFKARLDTYPTETAWLGIIAYSLQIYFDFSGYSDMAIGLGKMIGFDFKENFNYPYIAHSVQDFWRRWHISLSSWFRDYVYIPLGGNRGTKFITYRNLLLVFFVTGLWHGASWNFIVWGLYHGLFLLIERAGLSTWLKRLWPPFAHAYTLLVILVGWVFFRAVSLSAAVFYLEKLMGLHKVNYLAFPLTFFLNGEVIVALVAGLVLSTPIYHLVHTQWRQIQQRIINAPAVYLTDTLYVFGLFGLFVVTIMYLAADTYNPFIYFRF